MKIFKNIYSTLSYYRTELLLFTSIFVVFAFFVVLCIHYVNEGNDKWLVFAKEHNCKIIESVPGSYAVVSGMALNGTAATGSVYIPGKDCWLCDDGRKYWR